MLSKIVALLLLLQTGTPPAVQQAQSRDKGSIEGVVLRSESGEPLARAQVKLLRLLPPDEGGKFVFFDGSDPETQGLPTALTESDGKFQLKDLPPGQYRLAVSRNGYTRQVYGQKFPSSPGRIINLAAGEAVKNFVFRMVPAGVVTGRVRDATGEPMPGLTVSLLRIEYGPKRKALADVDTARTDDRGEYRLFWVPPGRYYLRVSRGYAFDSPKAIVMDPTIPRTYYPGTLDVSSASVIEVQAGAELGAIDVVLPKSSGHWIRGRAVDSTTGKPPKSLSLAVSPRQLAAIVDNEYGETAPEYDSTTGNFAIRNVVPGSYWLSASSSMGFDSPISPDRLAEVRTGADVFDAVFASGSAAQVTIDMPASDLNDVVLTLVPGSSIPLRVQVEGKDFASIKDMDKLRVELSTADESQGYRQSTRLNGEGVARIENVLPGRYRPTVSMPKSMDLYLKQILYGRNDVLYEPLQFTDQQPSALTVLLSDKGGRIEGTLSDALSQPVGGVEVVLIPDLRERQSLFETVTTDRDGHFVFSRLAPGGYKVFAWEALPPNAYYDNEVLSKYETQGRPVQIQESSKATGVDLKIIPEGRQ